MGNRRALSTMIATTVACAVLATSCAKAAHTSEVSADAPEGVSLQTSTTVAAGSKTTVKGSSSTKTASAAKSDLAKTATELVQQLASDPAMLQQLTGLDLTQISALLGMNPTALGGLGISPDAIRSLASVIAGMNPNMLKQLASGSAIDPKLASTMLALAGQLDPASAAALKGLNPLGLASLLTTATKVDPKVAAAMGSVLQAVDPNGLGRLATDQTSLALLAVLFGVAMRVDPSQFSQLGNASAVSPEINSILTAISGLAAGLTPEVVKSINGLSKALGPDTLKALSAVMAILGRPDVGPVIQAAATDPVVLITTLGTFGLLIPGLAEVLAPDTFLNNPSARYAALAGLIGVAIANMSGFDLKSLSHQLGLG
ncbi:MAG TPA: hypothetical protein PLS63_02990 [Microthrixaceae bacterium]|nr:hypothetical protein [Microthrixaceae bacterium]